MLCSTTMAIQASSTTNSVSPAITALFEHPLGKPNYRDPFFPKSIRYTPIQKPEKGPNDASAPVDFYKDLIVKGISSGPRGRLAIINNQTVAVGDVSKITKGIQNNLLLSPLYVKIIEIKDRSVVIKVEGAPESKELPLKF